VPDLNLARVADELYDLSPAEFTAARDERARQARAEGERAASDAIRKLRRPTVSAWLVNRLVREASDQVSELLELGRSLRQAQQSLAAGQLRELSARRRELIRALVMTAKQRAAEAGRPVSNDAEREVEATLEAALADPAAADAVRSGRLTVPLSYAGFGEVDIGDAVAVPAAPHERAHRRPADGPPADAPPADVPPGDADRPGEQRADEERERREASELARLAAQREREAAERELRAADAAARKARATLDDAEQRAAEVRDAHQAARRRMEDLAQRLEQAREEEDRAAQAVRDTERNRDAVAGSFDAAQRHLAQARARLDPRSGDSMIPET
jgi:hypothetical protein